MSPRAVIVFAQWPVPAWLVAAALLAGAPSPGMAQERLTEDDVRSVVARAASQAARIGLPATVAVVDAQGAPLAVFRMAASPVSVAEGQPARSGASGCGREGLEGLALPGELVALSKAATGALLSTSGHAFSSRTAGFLALEHFPPTVNFTPAGPLFGIQFSSLSCGGALVPGLPLGLSLEPGGIPLYRDGRVVGGVGVEGDGGHGLDPTPLEYDLTLEERAALAGAAGFEPPETIRAERVVLEGMRLPYAQPGGTTGAATPAGGVELLAPRGAAPSRLVPARAGGLDGWALPGVPVRGGRVLGAGEVAAILDRVTQQSARTRSALRLPLNSPARVSVAVVDVEGALLGLFHREDAPGFGIDTAVQKARTAAFFSGASAGEDLRRAGLAAFAQEVPLDGTVAYTSRAVGFLGQPYLPPGVEGSAPGPFGVPGPPVWSAGYNGLQSEMLCAAFESALAGVAEPACTGLAGLPGGLSLAPGGVPLYKDGRLAGAVGVSGDGADQDDLIAAAGTLGFEAPPARRSDRVSVRGVRLPYLKFPRHPEL
jgi:uncharacterized protein GlcG (DUF336 family)